MILPNIYYSSKLKYYVPYQRPQKKNLLTFFCEYSFQFYYHFLIPLLYYIKLFCWVTFESNHPFLAIPWDSLQFLAISCNFLQFLAIPCNSLQFLAIPCNFLQFLAISYNSLGDFLQNIRKNNYFHARDTWTKQAWPFSMHFLFSKILNIFQRFFLWLKWCWGGLKWECVKSCWQHDCRQFENQRISWKPADLEATKCQL